MSVDVAEQVTEITGTVVGALTESLGARKGPLATRDQLDPDLLRNVQEIIAETVAVVRGGQRPGPVSVDYVEPGFAASAELAVEQDMHPAESLMAAEALFDVALEPVVEALAADGYTAVAVARALHHAIWRRFPPGAIAYTNMLRRRLITTEHDTRTVIARDLHDRVAHGILTSLQRIDLVSRVPASESRRAMAVEAAALLRVAIEDVRSFAARLREQVGERGLASAIERFGATAVAGVARLEVSCSGGTSPLLRWQDEEVLAITLEAVRNAVRHAAPTTVRVHLDQQPDHVVVTVRNDGRRLPPGRDDGLGITGMHERAALLGATLAIGEDDAGTVVTVVVHATPMVSLGPGDRP
jgi:signal transduction histidine kinase